MNHHIATITEQIYRVIQDGILSRRWAAGEKLTTKALQELLGVSSTPIREALTRLQQDGLLEYQPNAGMRVVRLSEADVTELVDLMREFDIIAMRFACASPQRGEMVLRLKALQEEAAACLAEQDSQRWEQLSDQFHLTFYQYANNSRLSETIRKIRLQFSLVSNAYQQIPDNQVEIQQEHDEVLDCLVRNDDVAAEEALRRHFAGSMQKAFAVYYENAEPQSASVSRSASI